MRADHADPVWSVDLSRVFRGRWRRLGVVGWGDGWELHDYRQANIPPRRTA
jgi:hypothetical protein